MRAAFLLWWLSALSILGQGFGSYGDLPFIGATTANTNIAPPILAALTNEILYVDIYSKVTNTSGSIAGNGDNVAGWGDLSANVTNSLIELGGAALCPTNYLTGGPTNGPCIIFGGTINSQMMLTNTVSGANISQPNTYFFVMYDINPLNPSGAILNGQPGQIPQWNLSTAGGGASRAENFYAGINAQFMDDTQVVPKGWPQSRWAIITMQFNSTNSLIRVNGSQLGNTSAFFNTGTNASKGLTLGNYYSGGGCAVGDRFCSLIWVTGTYWTNSANMLAVERLLGQEFGISTP